MLMPCKQESLDEDRDSAGERGNPAPDPPSRPIKTIVERPPISLFYSASANISRTDTQ
jgi:hypothetical protein